MWYKKVEDHCYNDFPRKYTKYATLNMLKNQRRVLKESCGGLASSLEPQPHSRTPEEPIKNHTRLKRFFLWQ